MRLRNCAVVCASLALASCRTYYVEPMGQETAALTFQNRSALNIGFQAFKVAEDCSGGKLSFAKDNLRSREEFSVKLQGGQPFSFFMAFSDVSMAGLKYCILPGTFTPKPGARYVARFAASETQCSMGLLAVTSAGETKEPSFRPRSWVKATFESGSFCR